MTTHHEPTGIVARPTTDAVADEPQSLEVAGVTFADFELREEIVDSLRDIGITSPFPIQAMTLPVALAGRDIIGQAKTGTGKTLGFGLPILNTVIAPGEDGWAKLADKGKPQALVVVPTRELALQVAGDLEAASRRRNVRIAKVFGGRAYEPQLEALKAGVEVVVGTPGRMIDLIKHKALDLSKVRVVVLDEADEMLDLGFLPDVEKILSKTPGGRSTMLFSATMPGPVVALARRYMRQPTHIRAADPHDNMKTVASVKQVVYRAHALNKVEMLARILQARGRGLTMIFARTKRTVANVAEQLTERGFAVAAIHGDLGQGAREQALRAFRNGKVDVLVATDVAARGIDVEDVTHVINYQCPEDEKVYLHRVGRTGRAGHAGTAVTLVDWDDTPRWSLINKALGFGNAEPVETYHTSAHLSSDLDIPEGVTGRLPRADRTRAGLDAEVLEDVEGKGKGKGGGKRRDDRSRQGRGAQAAPDAQSAPDAKATPRRRPRRRTRRSSAEGMPGAAGE